MYSMYALGTCCERGIGMDADLEQAVIWFEQAASGGMAKAMYWLGRHYAFGTGIERDLSKAIAWYKKLRKQGMATPCSA